MFIGLATALALLTAAAIAVNIKQNGDFTAISSSPLPKCTGVADVKALRRKADFVRLWHEGTVPAEPHDEVLYDGHLLRLGVLAPVSAFITNHLFAPGRRWEGKAIVHGQSGINLFRDGRRRGFSARADTSALDGRPALVLDYAARDVGDLLWGRVLGMRDELREVAPGLLFGLGSMRATGGVRNAAPFVLVRRGGERVS